MEDNIGMDNYTDKLAELIELKKKKKEPNNSEKKKFAASWDSLVEEQGFSADAENFLYEGFTFCGAKPFIKYMNKKENQTEALNELYDGKLYGKNCATTSSLLIHLLGLILLEQDVNTSVLISIMQHIPSALKNKDGKRYGQADRAFKKYIFEEIKSDTKLPETDILKGNGLDIDSLKEFADVVDEIKEKLESEKLSENCKNNMNRFYEWVHAISEKKEDISASDSSSQILNNFADDACINDESNLAWKEEMDRLYSELHGMRQKINAMEQLRMMFERETEGYRNRIALQDEIIQTNENELALKNKRIQDLLLEQENLEHEILAQSKKIQELKEEVSQRDAMVQMIKRDRSKQADEGINRMESKLKPYFTDYKDAENLEMSVDLGENIRDQFGEVLSIISSFISSAR